MKTSGIGLVGIVFSLAAAFTPTNSLGQVDPEWLKNWREAQKSRPVSMSSRGTIAPKSEPGVPLTIHGLVVGPDEKPASDVIVHSYHRDSDGFDFGPRDNALTTWRLQGWAKSDAKGRFEFETIRPAPDHLGREGAHIHFNVESSIFGRQWAPTVFLADDPSVTTEQRRRSKEAGEFAWVRQVRTVDGVQHIDVKIRIKEKADF